MKLARNILALALTILPMVAAAQLAPDGKIVASVPFAFTVGNRNVPAGEVSVQRTPMSDRNLLIRNLATRQAVVLPAGQAEAKDMAENCTLVFHKYGDQYFLSAIKLANDRTVYRMAENKAEAELRAQSHHKAEEVIVASLR